MTQVLLRILIPAIAVASGNAQLVHDIDQAQLAREEKMTAYTVTETYTLRNARFGEAAELVVNVSYTRGAGKTYQVVSRQGPSFLHTRVFDRMLQEEGEMSRGTVRQNSLITSANYQMKPAGQQVLDGRTCDVLELTPRRSSPHLLHGKAWVDARTHNMIRVAGKPAASLSFWAGTPMVVRDYIEIGEFSFGRRSRVVTQGFLLGRSELNVDYTGYQIMPPDALVIK